MKSHIIGFLLVTLAQIPMPIKIGTTFQNKLRPSVDDLLVQGRALQLQLGHQLLQDTLLGLLGTAATWSDYTG